MKIDLHIHTKTGSDGALSIEEVFREAKERNIDLMSITDHDTTGCQERAIALAQEYGITGCPKVLEWCSIAGLMGYNLSKDSVFGGDRSESVQRISASPKVFIASFAG